MGVISIREFNANVSRALARVEAGEVLEISRNGKVIAELRPKSPRGDNAERRAARERLLRMMEEGFEVGAPFTYEERTR
jgi:prevent-host-death family protein